MVTFPSYSYIFIGLPLSFEVHIFKCQSWANVLVKVDGDRDITDDRLEMNQLQRGFQELKIHLLFSHRLMIRSLYFLLLF